MFRPTASLLLLLTASSPAAAEDFTGFYAGVNAGWAFERGRDAAAPLPPTGSARDGAGLPPSLSRIEERRRPEPTAAARGR